MHTASEAEAWGLVAKSADRLKSADKLVLSAPMWNFGVKDVREIFVDPASRAPGADEAAREKAVGEARAMAAGV